MKRILLLPLLPLLLTSCSNPDTSGGVTLSKGADDANEFPHGSCEGPHKNPPDSDSGCGWIHVNDHSYYIMPGADLWYADLSGANLNFAILTGADLMGANLTEANLRYAYLHGADLSDAWLHGADLSNADLTNADLSGAKQAGVKSSPGTICPNGKDLKTAGNDCVF